MIFSSTIEQLDRYHLKHYQNKTEGFDAHIVHEIREKLRQLDFLYSEIFVLQEQLMAESEGTLGPKEENKVRILVCTLIGPPQDLDQLGEYGNVEFAASNKLWMFTEAFYYFAHRALVLVRERSDSLPDILPIEAVGVSRVRNNLIEHANRKSGIDTFSFSISDAAGVRLRPVKQVGESEGYMDEGIIINAAELKEKLERSLTQALKAP